MRAGISKFYGLSESHKKDTALRPILFNRGTNTYLMAKKLARILRPLIDNSPHQIKSTKNFVE